MSSLQAWPVDDFVGALILEALTPSAIDVSLHLAEDIELERRQQYRQWDQRLERARYEVELAQRRYEALEAPGDALRHHLARLGRGRIETVGNRTAGHIPIGNDANQAI